MGSPRAWFLSMMSGSRRASVVTCELRVERAIDRSTKSGSGDSYGHEKVVQASRGGD